MIKTLGQARDSGMKITARCPGGPEGLESIRQCRACIRLDLETLVWTRGASFPISMLEGNARAAVLGANGLRSRKENGAKLVQNEKQKSA